MLSTKTRCDFFFCFSCSAPPATAASFFSLPPLNLFFLLLRARIANTICHTVKKPVKQHRRSRFATFCAEREREHVEERRSLHTVGHNGSHRSRLQHLRPRASYVTREENVMRRCWRCGPGTERGGERSANSSGKV